MSFFEIKMPSKVILYIAMSLDGYIADIEGNIDFLNIAELEGEDYGYNNFTNTINTLIWGRKTYDKVMSFGIDFPYPNKRVIVLSKTLTGKNENVEFYTGDLKTLINSIKETNNSEINYEKKSEVKHIYCDGGGEIVAELLKNNLIDKLIITIIPHLLGSGIRLFKNNLPPQKLKFLQSNSYRNGVVQLHYEILHD